MVISGCHEGKHTPRLSEVKCPKCGGQLVYETFGQYGRVHKVGADGRIHKRYITNDYGGDDVILDMIYCSSCGHEITSICKTDGITVKIVEGAGHDGEG
jgi:DNA-directed RNA polymerase subunit RPC12/RpoP